MKQEDLIRTAIDNCISKNIKIIRGPIFIFEDKIIAANALGAVLIENNSQDIIHDKGWRFKLCEMLDVNGVWWLFRFSVGFDNLNQIFVEKGDNSFDGSKTVEVKDEASALGIKLARIYTLKD